MADVDTCKVEHGGRIETDRAPAQRRLPCPRRPAGRAAAKIQNHLRCDRQAILQESGIDTTFETAARIGRERELLPCPRDGFGREISAFDQHLCRTVLCARMLAAHNAATIMDRLAVGDDSHAVIQPVGLAVKGKHRSEERRGGKEWGSTCRYRWVTD